MILTFNNKILTAGSKWLEPGSSPAPGPGFRTVVIDSGGVYPTLEWMAENLAIDDGGDGITAVNIGEVAGFNYGTQYYYTWDAAQRIAATLGDGWRVPTVNDFGNLSNATSYITGTSYQAGGYQLKSTSGWTNSGNGVDSVGVGINASGNVLGNNAGEQVWLWTSTIYSDPYGSACKLYNNTSAFQYQQYVSKDSRFSIRLVRDVV